MTNQEARLYSKYMAQSNPDTYNMRLFDAACATSAAPVFWQLKCTPHPCNNIETHADGSVSTCVPEDGACEYLIDGGVVQNNPSVYALSIGMMHADAKFKAGDTSPRRPVRLISIGTGGSPIFDRIENDETN